ncbi:sigma factor [Nonomuraea sp. NPDC059194]|uniref:sigma factor n=1 Tax=Nonomuraea sp. NPDC059194 TaxID=3346764 RepID=UPI0036AAD469
MEEGFADYVTQRHGRLRRTAYLLTGNWATAEDLVQTALARAWLAWRRIEGDPDPYVYRILTNTHVSWWRRRWRGELPSPEVPDLVDPAPDFAREVGERDALWGAIGGCGARGLRRPPGLGGLDRGEGRHRRLLRTRGQGADRAGDGRRLGAAP